MARLVEAYAPHTQVVLAALDLVNFEEHRADSPTTGATSSTVVATAQRAWTFVIDSRTELDGLGASPPCSCCCSGANARATPDPNQHVVDVDRFE